MSESTYSLFQRGRRHLRAGMAAQATVSLEKAKRREPDKASIREALGIAYFRIRRWSEAEAEFRALLESARHGLTRRERLRGLLSLRSLTRAADRIDAAAPAGSGA